MNQEVKKKWIEALLSGKYKKGMGALRSFDNKFCCLGVLCDLYSKETGEPWVLNNSKNCYTMYGIEDVLPSKVQAWADLPPSPSVIAEYVDKRGKMKKQDQTLGDINDFGVRFATIAKYIKEQL